MFKLTKDPSAVLDYVIDWEAWLGADTIVSSAWSAAEGLTLQSFSHTAVSAAAWVSGGAAGKSYTLTNTITTAAGRTDQRSFLIHVMER